MFTLKPDVIHLAAWLCRRVKFICRDRGGLSGGLLPVLPDCRPVCGEPVRGGAGNGCYGKCPSPAALWLPGEGVLRLPSFSQGGVPFSGCRSFIENGFKYPRPDTALCFLRHFF
ncbi:hypothetical protein AI17_004886, partial [Salmonella enterica subsp. enterica serovar Oslo]|nr:hypothetical protein [Salmonella enterica subsp. enterica serovar Oslo]